MGRFIVYMGKDPILLADLITKPRNSVINQCGHGTSYGDVNGDGFGVGWYDSPAVTKDHSVQHKDNKKLPCVFTSITPAWSNLNLSRLAEKIYSRLVFAHVRKGQPGHPVAEVECHPFQYGSFLWMHGGSIPCFPKFKRKLRRGLREDLENNIQGNTDSEHAFAVFLNEVNGNPATSGPLGEAEIQKCLRSVVRKIKQWILECGENDPQACCLNFAVSDGQTTVVSNCTTGGSANEGLGYTGLYLASGSSFVCQDGDYRMVHENRKEKVVILASEPLTYEEMDWYSVPINRIVTVTSDARVLIAPSEDD